MSQLEHVLGCDKQLVDGSDVGNGREIQVCLADSTISKEVYAAVGITIFVRIELESNSVIGPELAAVPATSRRMLPCARGANFLVIALKTDPSSGSNEPAIAAVSDKIVAKLIEKVGGTPCF